MADTSWQSLQDDSRSLSSPTYSSPSTPRNAGLSPKVSGWKRVFTEYDPTECITVHIFNQPSIWHDALTPSEDIWGMEVAYGVKTGKLHQLRKLIAETRKNSGAFLQEIDLLSSPTGVEGAPVLHSLTIPTTRTSISVPRARYFVIKSHTEDDVYHSIKRGVWTSTDMGNRRLNSAFREATNNGFLIFLFFSVNASGHFCGVAQMTSEVDYSISAQKWNKNNASGGLFHVNWLYVKDIPNNSLRHLRMSNNENKPITCCRDTQEANRKLGEEMMTIFERCQARTSILEDSLFFEDGHA